MRQFYVYAFDYRYSIHSDVSIQFERLTDDAGELEEHIKKIAGSPNLRNLKQDSVLTNPSLFTLRSKVFLNCCVYADNGSVFAEFDLPTIQDTVNGVPIYCRTSEYQCTKSEYDGYDAGELREFVYRLEHRAHKLVTNAYAHFNATTNAFRSHLGILLGQ